MATPALRPQITAGYLALALRLQEASTELSASDTCARLRDALNDAFRGTGNYCYYIDHFGDSESGDVIYCCGGDTRRASYEISGGGDSAAVCTIDTDHSENVVPRTVYEVEADEADHYAQMEESLKASKLYTALPLYERFISKSERASMPSEDFAGKNKSYPIKSAADVDAAFHSLGRAGSDNYSVATIRSNIIKIAKRKGFKLPKSAQAEAKGKESASTVQSSPLRLVESGAGFLAEIALREARVNYPIKLISPGTGTMAHYPADVLAQEAGKFKAGTLMFWNHPTAAEEAARPEGNLDNLAAITTSDGRWEPNGVKGPGIYAEAKVMADYAQKVEERAPHIGLSIRAGGTSTGRLVEGKPELKTIEYVESVDYVTKAGRGGMALAEAARNAGLLPAPGAESHEEVSDMDAAELKKLQESQVALQETNRRLLERAIRGDARDEATRLLESVTLPPASKLRVIESVAGPGITPPTKDGELDKVALKTLVEAAQKREGEYLTAVLGNAARPLGLGPSLGAEPDPVKLAEANEKQAKGEKKRLKEARNVFMSFGLTKEAATLAAQGRAS